MFESVKKELSKRKTESAQIKSSVEAERKRLEEIRQHAKSKDPLRKIKVVDTIKTKSEKKKDEKALEEFERKETERVAKERTARYKQAAGNNKKKIAAGIAAVVIAVAGGTAVSKSAETNKINTQYDAGVAAILDGEYNSAKQSFSMIEKYDSDNLNKYATLLDKLDSYEGRPVDLLNDLEAIGRIDNEGVAAHYSNLKKQAELLVEVSNEIDSIDIKQLLDGHDEQLNSITRLISQLEPAFLRFINIENYEIAKSILYNLENDTAAGKVMLQINALGTITLDSQPIINEARAAYDALTPEDKALVVNLNDLSDAEGRYNVLVLLEEARLKAEQEAAEREAREKEEAERLAKEEADRKAQESSSKTPEGNTGNGTSVTEGQPPKGDAGNDGHVNTEPNPNEDVYEYEKSIIVYVTATGKKYHRDGCRHLSQSKIAKTLWDAKNEGYTPCKDCY